jgi:hypothetical protein
MKLRMMMFVAFLSLSTTLFAQEYDVAKIDEFMMEIKEQTRIVNGRMQYFGLQTPYHEILDQSEYPNSVIQKAWGYVTNFGNTNFIRVYKVHGRRHRINDKRAVGYVSVFATVGAIPGEKTQVAFYYVFSNYRGRVIYHLTSDSSLR